MTTNRYLVTDEDLYFQDNDENKDSLRIRKTTASELLPKDNDEFDSESNLFIHQDPISVTYYPK